MHVYVYVVILSRIIDSTRSVMFLIKYNIKLSARCVVSFSFFTMFCLAYA